MNLLPKHNPRPLSVWEGAGVFFRPGFHRLLVLSGYVRAVQKVINADTVKIRKGDQIRRRYRDCARLILGIRVLCYVQNRRNLLLAQTAVFPERAKVFVGDIQFHK